VIFHHRGRRRSIFEIWAIIEHSVRTPTRYTVKKRSTARERCMSVGRHVQKAERQHFFFFIKSNYVRKITEYLRTLFFLSFCATQNKTRLTLFHCAIIRHSYTTVSRAYGPDVSKYLFSNHRVRIPRPRVDVNILDRTVVVTGRYAVVNDKSNVARAYRKQSLRAKRNRIMFRFVHTRYHHRSAEVDGFQ